jgi:DNA-binding response OmpR family regulator
MDTQPEHQQALPPATILVVDDHPEVVDILSHLLKRNGLNVLAAYNGSHCLEIVQEKHVDVVILDVMMPKMDGLTVCAELKQISPSLPVILVTARDDVQTRHKGMMLGVSEFVVKPINNSDLMARVQTQIHTRQWEREIDQTSATIEDPAPAGPSDSSSTSTGESGSADLPAASSSQIDNPQIDNPIDQQHKPQD